MLFAIKNRENCEKLEDQASLKNQVEEFRLQDKFGKQTFHENTKNLFEPVIDTHKNTSEKVTKTITETFFNNNKAIENLNEKLLKLMNDKGMIAPYLASSSVNIFKPENKSQIRLKKDLNPSKMSDFLIDTSVPFTLYSNVLTFKDTTKSFKLDENFKNNDKL